WVLMICLEGYAVTGITSQEIETGRRTAGIETESIGTGTRAESPSTGMMRTGNIGTGMRSGSPSTGMMRTGNIGTGTRSDAIEATMMTMTMKGGVIEITRMSIVGTGTMMTMMMTMI
ncbi:Type III secretion outermembrane pore forming protein (YscC,MxiD,HrcC, InvG), partial [uncultured Synechococcales cyanobacterium]